MRRLEGFWEAWCCRRGLLWELLLWPLSVLYGSLSLLMRRGKPSSVPKLEVISVGNLSLGGSGKTPLVQAIVRAASKRRLKPAVIMRGYGADEAGLYEGTPVFQGADRLAGAHAAVKAGCGLAILDDGFQRRHQLARRLDILVLDWSRRGIESHCLPAGRLREPLSQASRAQALVVTHAPAHWNGESLRRGLPREFSGLRIFRGDHRPLGLRALKSGKRQPLSWLNGRKVTALSGIGNPAAFEGLLGELGAKAISLRFPDHHAYREGDLRLLPSTEAIVCTAKDAVKLDSLLPVWILDIEMKVSPEKEFFRMLFP